HCASSIRRSSSRASRSIRRAPSEGRVVGPLDRGSHGTVQSAPPAQPQPSRAAETSAPGFRPGTSGGSPVPLRAVETTRLYRQIADQIVGLIESGEFPAGSRLPPERELAALLGVSRTSVREAIIALEISGRVEVRVGTGIFVTNPRALKASASQ